MIFLGTGSAELVPSPFCECNICETAREKGGVYHKKRSSFMPNERVLIDFGPDVPVACQIHGVSLTRVEHIFITHTHTDHLQLSNLWMLGVSKKKLNAPIHMYMSGEAYTYCKPIMETLGAAYHYEISFGQEPGCRIVLGNGNEVIVRVLKPYERHAAGNMMVFAVQSNHRTHVPDEYAFNYVLELENGAKLLYACDTGLYSSSNLEALADARLDYLVMEATFGDRPLSDQATHLNGENFIRMVDMMSDYRIIDEHTQIYSSHLSQAHDFHHDDLQRYFDKHSRYPIKVAYDGMTI